MEGKQLNLVQQKQSETAMIREAIALLMKLDNIFIKEKETIPVIIKRQNETYSVKKEKSRSYYRQDELPVLFEKRLSKEKERSRMTSPDTFAGNETLRIGHLLDTIRNTGSDSEYYTNHDAWNSAICYLEFLQLHYPVDRLKNQAGSIEDNPKGPEEKKMGRPKKQNHTFKEYLTCSEEEKDKIVEFLKGSFQASSYIGIITTIKALEKKSYFNKPAVSAELWDSIRLIFEDQKLCTNQNFIKHYKNDYHIKDISKAADKLP